MLLQGQRRKRRGTSGSSNRKPLCWGSSERDLIGPGHFTQEYQGRWGCGEQRTANSLLRCRGENPSSHLIPRESELNNRPPVGGRVNAGQAPWLALDGIISRDPDRLPRKGVKQATGSLWRGSQEGTSCCFLSVHRTVRGWRWSFCLLNRHYLQFA